MRSAVTSVGGARSVVRAIAASVVLGLAGLAAIAGVACDGSDDARSPSHAADASASVRDRERARRASGAFAGLAPPAAPGPRRAPVPLVGARLRVTFVSIGEPAPFWNVVHAFMAAAADDLDVDLEVLNARGDHLRMGDFADEVCARPDDALPHYLILNNEKDVIGGRMLERAMAAGVPVLSAFGDFLDAASQARFGAPRERYPLWVGAIRPDNDAAGYDIAARLCREARDRFAPPVGVLALGGTKATPAAQARERGLARALAEEGDRFVLQQLVHSMWQRPKAASQMVGLLRRWPDTRVIWAANDPMALGALDAAVARGLTPGRDVLIGGLNWGTDALAKVRAGELVTSVGGHFMGGAWALVLLRDLADGLDFAEVSGSPAIQFRMGVIDRANVERYLEHFGEEDWAKIDFRRFLRSARRDHSLAPYDFTLEAILGQLD